MDTLNWKELQSSIDCMCSRHPDKRLDAKQILETSFFKSNVLIDVVEHLKEIQGIPLEIKMRMMRYALLD